MDSIDSALEEIYTKYSGSTEELPDLEEEEEDSYSSFVPLPSFGEEDNLYKPYYF